MRWPWQRCRRAHLRSVPPPRPITRPDVLTDEFSDDQRRRASKAIDESRAAQQRLAAMQGPAHEVAERIRRQRQQNHWAETFLETIVPSDRRPPQ